MMNIVFLVVHGLSSVFLEFLCCKWPVQHLSGYVAEPKTLVCDGL